MLRRVTDICFLKMLVNAVQYRVTVGIFNNQKLMRNLIFELPSCSKLSNNLPNYDQSFISLFITFFSLYFRFQSHDKTNFEASTIESITSQFRLHQLINEPTQLLQNSSSCIDLIFTPQPNIVVEPGVHPSLHPNCHHQIIFGKFNVKIYYPPPYLREVWHYKEANQTSN